MKAQIHASPSFAYLEVELDPGESIIAEASAMSTMAGDLDLNAEFNGGFFQGLLRRYLGGESLFVSRFTNRASGPRRLTLAQGTPGDMMELRLDGNEICLQPGAYIASTDGVRTSLRWAGIASWFAGEGLFKMQMGGRGTVWFGAYGGLIHRTVRGELIVDSSHLVAYDPQIRLKIQLSGGLFSSYFSGEGFVTRVEGHGNVIIQSRSITGLARWLRNKLTF